MTKKQVYVLSGIPGSGKSTWRQEFLNKNEDLNVCVISGDDIREELGMSSSDPRALSIMLERYSESIKDKSIDVIIVDSTNLTPKRRAAYLRKNVKLTVVFFFTSIETSVVRVRNREKVNSIPYEIIKEAAIALTPPVIGLDCDSFILAGESFFNRRELSSYRDELTLASINKLSKFTPLVAETIINNELNMLYAPHESSYHMESIDEHIDMCLMNSDSVEMRIISLFHDLGKSLARVHHEGMEYASYKRHERFSSVMFLNYLYSVDSDCNKEYTENNPLMLAILYHMITVDLSPKVISRYSINKELMNSLLKFNRIDRMSSIRKDE